MNRWIRTLCRDLCCAFHVDNLDAGPCRKSCCQPSRMSFISSYLRCSREFALCLKGPLWCCVDWKATYLTYTAEAHSVSQDQRTTVTSDTSCGRTAPTHVGIVWGMNLHRIWQNSHRCPASEGMMTARSQRDQGWYVSGKRDNHTELVFVVEYWICRLSRLLVNSRCRICGALR